MTEDSASIQDDFDSELPEEEAAGSEYVDRGVEDTAWEALRDWQPAATYDVLFLVDTLGRQDPPGRMELHSFAYLACLMSVFRGDPASEWGYAFSAVPPTLPFSPAIEVALTQLASSGRLESLQGGYESASREFVLTVSGAGELEFLSRLQSFGPRIEFLRAAAKTAVFTSLPAVVNSLGYEPQLAQALRLDNARMLLTEISSAPLYQEFDALLEVLGPEHHELVIPASMYVRYLQQRAEQAIDRALTGEDGE